VRRADPASRRPPVYAGHYRGNAAPFGKFKTSDAERGGVPAPLLAALRRARLARRGPGPLAAVVSRATGGRRARHHAGRWVSGAASACYCQPI